jgi:hypothetical protein
MSPAEGDGVPSTPKEGGRVGPLPSREGDEDAGEGL